MNGEKQAAEGSLGSEKRTRTKDDDEKPNSTARILGNVSGDDRGEHVAETFLEFRATGGVVHFDALAFATNQAGFAQDFEMLGEGRLGQGAVVDLAEVGAIQGAFRDGHFRVDLGAHGIGQGIKKPFDSNIADSGMEEWPHSLWITRT
jgi:hypothetical protein